MDNYQLIQLCKEYKLPFKNQCTNSELINMINEYKSKIQQNKKQICIHCNEYGHTNNRNIMCKINVNKKDNIVHKIKEYIILTK